MLGKKVGIDLGTATTRVVTRGEGSMVAEPSVVALREGEAGLSLMGVAALEATASDDRLVLRRPLQGGDIQDERALDTLMHHAVNRAIGRQRIFKPDLVIAVRGGMSGDDRRLVLEAAARAGARTVYLIDAAIAASLGAGISVTSPQAHLVIDIGAGKTDIAVLALEGTVAARSLSTGADDLLDGLAAHIAASYGTTLNRTELLAATKLLVAASHEERTAEVGGVLLSSHELAPIVADHLRGLDTALLEVLEEAPAALARDARSAGAILTGGGARLEGMERHVAAVAGCSARVVRDADACTVRGAAMAADNLDVLKRNFMYIR